MSATNAAPPSVVIVQRILTHYRVPFFERLHHRLAQRNIEFRLVHGQEFPGTVPVSVRLDRPWVRPIVNRYLSIAGKRLVWQPCHTLLRHAELTIVEQANSLLLNFLLLTERNLGRRRLALWGHGRNFQAGSGPRFGERVKSALATRVDWWFAYTEASAAVLRARGFPAERLTVVNNAIDTEAFQAALDAVTPEQLSALRQQLGIDGHQVGLYCGGITAGKHPDFLVATAEKIRERVPDFHLIAVGNGPAQGVFERAAREHPWFHYVGPRFGADRAVYFRASRLLLLPGPVGLSIIDAFAAATPLFTTDLPSHGPEIAYLRPGEDGMMTAHEPDALATAVVAYLGSPDLAARLRRGCRDSAGRYGLDACVANFADGIEQCLAR